MQKSICILTLYLFIFALNSFLHRFRYGLELSLTNENHFSSILAYDVISYSRKSMCLCMTCLLYIPDVYSIMRSQMDKRFIHEEENTDNMEVSNYTVYFFIFNNIMDFLFLI